MTGYQDERRLKAMNDNQFTACVLECAAYTDRESYISKMATSSIWGDSADAEIPQNRIDAIGAIWDAVNRSVRDIVANSGLSQAAFAERYCIPKRTLENWCFGSRECPIYLRLLLQRAENLITV